MFVGKDPADIDDPAFWASTRTAVGNANPNINGTTYGTRETGIFCFAAGTHIATPSASQAVETLRIGDLVPAHGGAIAPAHWAT